MTQITSEVLLVADLFMKGRFAVPWHQRYYDWTEEQVSELLDDLKEAIAERRTSYFLGSIMLVHSGEHDDVWHINDGQQRLITLSLLIAALCRRFAARRKSDSPREQRSLRLLFNRPENTTTNLDDTTKDTPRIKPPRQDRSRFTQLVRGHDIGTNGKLTSAWNKIVLFVADLTLVKARRFFDFLADNVEIGVLYVPLSEDANAVFEALNGRGKQLDDVDLIRNHLYSHFTGRGDNERRDTVHGNLESILPNSRTARRRQEYFRCFFQCRFGYLKKTRFYRDARSKIQFSSSRRNISDYVYRLVEELADKRFVELFRTMSATNPNPEFLAAFMRASATTSHKRNLPALLSELVGYKVVQPLVFALLRKFVESQSTAVPEMRRLIARNVHRSLSDLASFIVRVSFCEAKFEPSRYEAYFANCAMRISSVTAPADLDIQTELRECDERNIMDDVRFASQLANVELKDMKRAKRLLFGINALQDREARALDFGGCAVEHVLPKSDTYWPDWSGFSILGSDAGRWVYRIGNLTLLGNSDNFARRRFNASFSAKKAVFETSPFAITRKLGELKKWNPTTINSRSAALAQAASQVWSFYRPLKRNA